MQDRISVNPGRVLISPENGAAYYATMTRADNPTHNGTPLNKASLLKDATAALFGLGVDAVPDDVINAIKTLIDDANVNADKRAQIATGSYTGTGKYGSGNKNQLTFDFEPKFVYITQSDVYTAVTVLLIKGLTGASVVGQTSKEYRLTVSWSDTTVTWYAASGTTGAHQVNGSGTTYRYVAIG